MKCISAPSGLIVVLLLIIGPAGSARALDLSGRCYSGQKPNESIELQGVPITLYGAPEEGGVRTQLDADTTASNGWYGLTIQEGYEHYFIVAGSVSGYSFNGAFSVSGAVSGNEIHYSTISGPLSEQTLTGNKFWYTSDAPQNHPPVANDDSTTTTQNVAVDIYVLNNDSDPDGDTLHINSATAPPHGTTTNHGSHVTYAPDPGFVGTDTFNYRAGDGKGGTATAIVTVRVEEGPEPENNPPVADADGPYTGSVGQPVFLDGSGSYDPDPGDSIISYEWDLDNDGQYDDATGMHTTWTWSTPGKVSVGLKVTDNHGEIDTDTSTVDVQEGPEDAYDFGDAPDSPESPSYPTLLANNGARHRINPDVYLGTQIDPDTDGQPSSVASGDDGDGTDDEDGVVIRTALISGSSVNVEVTASVTGYLNAWVDLGRDGNWGQADDHVFVNIPLNTGLNNLTLYVPSDVTPGITFGRFRFSQAPGLSYDGEAEDGEVEDYLVEIDAGMQPPPTNTPGPVTFPHGDWPTYAQDEISVHPEPPMAGSLTRLCAEVVNTDPVNAHVVFLEFRVANFGIGLPWNTVGSTSVHVPPGSLASGCVVWPSPGPGHWCIEVVLHQEGAEPQHSQRNIDADEPLQPGESHSLTFPVGNPFDHSVDITLGLVPHLPNWGLELHPDILQNMAPGEIREVTLTVTPPQGEPLPTDGTVIVDVEAYAEGVLIGGFRKIFRPPVPLHRFRDPPYAESEITVHPYPVRLGEPVEVCVELRNPTADPQDVMVQFSWASFGIGIPFTPINGLRPVHLPPHSIVKECIHWVPPVSGSVCIQVELHMDGYDPQRSQRNMDIDEPLRPGESHSLTFPVGNPHDHPVDITLGLIPHLPNWGLELYPDILPNMAPGEIRQVTLTVTPPPSEPLPADGTVIVDVEAYAEGELIGGFRKAFSPPVTVHRPKDPIYAETEIGVDPYPIVPGQPVQLSVELRNPTSTDQIVQTHFSVAPFGIGLPFSDEHIIPNPIHIFVPAHGAARGHVTWNPPPGITGKFCVQVMLELEGQEPQWSRRNMDVGEPLRRGEPHSLDFVLGSSPYTEPVTIALGLVKHRAGWDIGLSDYVLPDVIPGEPVTVTLTVTPPLEAELGTGEPIVDVEAYVDGKLLGGFRKLDVPPVSVHKLHEKRYAETEIIVDPYPPQAGQETRVSAVLQNTGEVPVDVIVEFGWADFGMGIPFSNVGMVPPVQMVTLAPSALTSVDAAWTPSQSGHQCILVRLIDPEGQLEPQESQRNVHVAEPPPCGETKVFNFTIYNDSASPVTVDLGLITFNVPSDWEVTTDPNGSVLVGPHDEVEIKVIVKIPCPPSLQVADILQRAGGGVPTIDVEGYIDGRLKGGIEIQIGEIRTEPGPALPMGQIHYSKTIDNGTVFEPGSIVEKAAAGSAQVNPDIAVDDQGIVHIVWEDYRMDPFLGNIMYAKSMDGGRRFGESVMVDDAITVSTHQARPRIALDIKGIIHVVWEDFRNDPPLGDIYYSKSTDGGRTFDKDVLVDDPVTVTSRQINPALAVDSRGHIHIVWEDYRDNHELGNIYYAKSTDGGQSFSDDQRINDMFDYATHHARPTIVAHGRDTVIIVWEDYRNTPSLGDIYCSVSSNGGQDFGENVMVDDPITVTSRQRRPAAAVDNSSILHVVWEDYRDNAERGNIYSARSLDGGMTFNRDVMVDSPFTTTTHQANPAIAVTGNGLVHVVWEDYQDSSEYANIYSSLSADGGKTFGENLMVEGQTSTPSSRVNPAIDVDEDGVVHLVWQE